MSVSPQTAITVLALYQFRHVGDPGALRAELAKACCAAGLRGTLIVAAEGINGTVAGTPDATAALLARLREHGFNGLEVKTSTAATMPFHRMKVRLKAEIVTMNVSGLDPVHGSGVHVDADRWHALLDDPDTVVIDTRNSYEVALGTFAGAVDPDTASFADFPRWLEDNRGRLEGRKLAMFCTGGIRCEKATALARHAGFPHVYHLSGGILRYLETVDEAASRWTGECFVFDERVSVVHGLDIGSATLCRACRHPLTAEDRRHPAHEEGVACHRCTDARTAEDKARYAERHRQVALAEARGDAHIGRAPLPDAAL